MVRFVFRGIIGVVRGWLGEVGDLVRRIVRVVFVV